MKRNHRNLIKFLTKAAKMERGFHEIFSEEIGSTCRVNCLVNTVDENGVASSWDIPDENYQRFIKLYCDAVNNGEEVRVQQITREVVPVIARLTIILSKEFAGNMTACTKSLVSSLQEFLRSEYDHGQTWSDSSFKCLVLSKDPVIYIGDDGEPETKLEYRFQFPQCVVVTSVYYKEVASKLTDFLADKYGNGNELFGCPMVGDWEDTFDESYVRSIPMYGSIEGDSDPLMDAVLYNDLYGGHTPDILDINSVLDLRNCKKVPPPADGDVGRDYYLPIVLSLDYWPSISAAKDKGGAIKSNLYNQSNKYNIAEFLNLEVETELDNKQLCDIFVKMWEPVRVISEEYYLILGEGMFDVFKGEQGGLIMWIKAISNALEMTDSELPKHFTGSPLRTILEKHYINFKAGRRTLVSIATYAKIDSPKAYENWHFSWCIPTYIQATSGKHSDVALALYRRHWLTYFISSSAGPATHYHFTDGRLRRDYGAKFLRMDMCGGLIRVMRNMKRDILGIGREQGHDLLLQARADDIINRIGKFVERLKDGPFKLKVVEESVLYMSRNGIDAHIDSDPELLGLQNGVLHATEHSIFYREAIMEDYVMKSCLVGYHVDMWWDHPNVREILSWSRKTFVDEELYKHFWKFLASILRGGNNDKKFTVFSGESGNNSKSMWIKALQAVLGPYCVKMPMNAIVGDRGNANGATPAGARTKNTRLMVLDEPEKEMVIKEGIIKIFTGGDDQYLRGLYQEGGEVTPHQKTLMVCNVAPKISNCGPAIRFRYVIYPFLSYWGIGAPESEEEQFEKMFFALDPYFDKKIPPMASALLWVMVNHYSLYVTEGLDKQPVIVTKTTEAYWRDNDLYGLFNTEAVEDAPEDVLLPIYTLYPLFKKWHVSTYSNLSVPDRPTVVSEYERRWTAVVDGGWKGKRIKKRFLDELAQ